MDDDLLSGLFGSACMVAIIVGYLIGGGYGAIYGLVGFVALVALVFAGGCLWAIHTTIKEDGGDPVTAYGCVLIAAAVVGMWIEGDGVMAAGIGLGLVLGLVYWKRSPKNVETVEDVA
jgi:hypothetical protein